MNLNILTRELGNILTAPCNWQRCLSKRLGKCNSDLCKKEKVARLCGWSCSEGNCMHLNTQTLSPPPKKKKKWNSVTSTKNSKQHRSLSCYILLSTLETSLESQPTSPSILLVPPLCRSIATQFLHPGSVCELNKNIQFIWHTRTWGHTSLQLHTQWNTFIHVYSFTYPSLHIRTYTQLPTYQLPKCSSWW